MSVRFIRLLQGCLELEIDGVIKILTVEEFSRLCD